MNKKFPLALIIGILCVSFAIGQKVNDDGAYNDMLAKVKGGDTSIDFKAFRVSFTKTKAYGPYGGLGDEVKQAFVALDKKDYKSAVKNAEKALEDSYVDMDAHVAASMGYKGLDDQAKSDLHKKIYLGLINSILNSGDGKSDATAYVVIDTHEEYIVLRALGLGLGSQSLQHKGEHSFDVMDITDPKTKQSVKIYFNIDIAWKAETDMFK